MAGDAEYVAARKVRSMEVNGIKESVAVFLAGSGLDLRCKLVRLTRHSALLEISSPDLVIRASEILPEFRLLVHERIIYSGRAVVRNVLETGSALLCEATLTESDWSDLAFSAAELQNDRLITQFREFLGEWQKLYRISPEYKVVVADMHTFFSDLKLWLDQVQMNLRSDSAGNAEALENEVATRIAQPVLPCIDALFEKFERVAETLPADHLPAHRHYMRRQLHSLVMCSPFAHRTFVKPLGYAVD